MTITRVAVVSLVMALVLPAVVMSAGSRAEAVKAPVSTFVSPSFGRVLSRTDKQVLYYWSVEKKAGGRVKCVGACAKAWPPLIVKSPAAVPRRIAGISGIFGTVRRPSGMLQVTRNKLPVYTYANERRRQVLCNNVNGWFVVRV